MLQPVEPVMQRKPVDYDYYFMPVRPVHTARTVWLRKRTANGHRSTMQCEPIACEKFQLVEELAGN